MTLSIISIMNSIIFIIIIMNAICTRRPSHQLHLPFLLLPLASPRRAYQLNKRLSSRQAIFFGVAAVAVVEWENRRV